MADKFADNIIYPFSFFYTLRAFFAWLKNHPNIFIAASDIAKNPKILEVLNIVSEFPAKPAIIAPTIITDEIALVTDIKGVWSDGVTLQTT